MAEEAVISELVSARLFPVLREVCLGPAQWWMKGGRFSSQNIEIGVEARGLRLRAKHATATPALKAEKIKSPGTNTRDQVIRIRFAVMRMGFPDRRQIFPALATREFCS
jgi:hypothetical protein